MTEQFLFDKRDLEIYMISRQQNGGHFVSAWMCKGRINWSGPLFVDKSLGVWLVSDHFGSARSEPDHRWLIHVWCLWPNEYKLWNTKFADWIWNFANLLFGISIACVTGWSVVWSMGIFLGLVSCGVVYLTESAQSTQCHVLDKLLRVACCQDERRSCNRHILTYAHWPFQRLTYWNRLAKMHQWYKTSLVQMRSSRLFGATILSALLFVWLLETHFSGTLIRIQQSPYRKIQF